MQRYDHAYHQVQSTHDFASSMPSMAVSVQPAADQLTQAQALLTGQFLMARPVQGLSHRSHGACMPRVIKDPAPVSACLCLMLPADLTSGRPKVQTFLANDMVSIINQASTPVLNPNLSLVTATLGWLANQALHCSE